MLACFNVDLIHKSGRHNVVPNALSRRQELRIIFTGESSLMKKICDGYQDDEESQKTLDTLRLGKKLEHFRLERGVVWFKQKRMLVPKGKLRRTQFRKEAGLLTPLPIPTKCWESVSIDFMTHFPESKGFDSIMVVVDRVSKMAHFVPTRDTAGTGFSPFMVVSGTEPLSPIDLALQGTSVKNGDEGEVVETKFFLEERKRILELAKDTLRRVQKYYKKQVNKNRR